jgi:hypothetical protein
MEESSDRLIESRRSLDGLRAAVVAGEPWPLSAAYGTEPESDWGPKEVLAHVFEMVPYWLAQIDAILSRPADAEPQPFGRAATDPTRIDRIGRDRERPAAELLAGIDAGLADAGAQIGKLSSADRARRGLHPRLGEMTIDEMVERFIVGHVDDHVRQLVDTMGRRDTVGADATG